MAIYRGHPAGRTTERRLWQARPLYYIVRLSFDGRPGFPVFSGGSKEAIRSHS